MIKLTDRAAAVLKETIEQDMQADPIDKLYVRLAMGIG
ncbi:hypothetical protein J2S17_000478 [Cytobacillus purgationiresistens]|uniref:Uncharacterized protein n=1 Tax=Cytobacillus purgationiresistens TaxID=863449 RepID=A0ABU0ACJ4_9BACI|nr:hypothetical protein [Cytobacillus purgationiresistens]